MKTLLVIFCLSLAVITAFSQTPTHVGVRIEDQFFKNHNEWKSAVSADLYDDQENLLPPSDQYDYMWEYSTDGGTSWILEASGYGLWAYHTDGNIALTKYIHVKVHIGQTWLTSGADIISKSGTPRDAYFFAKKEDGSALTPSDGVFLQNYTNPHWSYHQLESNPEPPPPYQFYLTDNSYELLRSFPHYVQSVGQKFNYWQPDQTHVLNHDSFYISSSSNVLRSQYKSTHDATIQSQLIDGGSHRSE